ncbi:DUF3772 domain-containing protein [Pseudoxanthomonas suwonensis]|uniref:DUF3772 domain-containing protein n=1 Tax=Pseudoxanthomonas suwonensis TaxID=314722 RepID=UPI00138ED141|nr:DUF3772 domain-containing protein [Pseudoxanthomonas suwonensis]KAF1699836.1 mechanosensitive ion channel protein MscS [Pseudoxanthomonas suwonensis]
MRRTSFLLRPFLLLCLLFVALPALCEDPDVDKGRRQLETISAQLERYRDDAALAKARETVMGIQAEAQALIDSRSPELQSLDARLAELGEVADGQAEARDVSRERRTLQDQRAAVDAELRQARLAVVEGSQLLERIAAMRQQRFFGLLSERTTPPWRPAFWRQLAASAPRDSSRLERLWQQTRDASLSHWKEAGIQPLLSLAVAGLVLAGSWLLRLRLTGMAATRVPAGRLRRSAPAMLRVVLALVASLCVMQLLRGALLPDNPPAAVAAIASRVVALGVFVAVATSLGRALLSVSRPSWRLPAISDAGARALRIFPLPAALLVALASLGQEIVTLARTSLDLAVAFTGLSAALCATLVLVVLMRIQRLQPLAQDADTPQGHFRPWMNAAVSLGWVGNGIALLGLLTGYVALSAFVGMQMIWAVMVAAAAWLAMRFIDDLVCAVLTSRGAAGKRMNTRFGIAPHLVDRVAVLLSVALRAGVALFALIALAMPWGAGGTDLVDRTMQLLRGITIGELVLSPGNIVRALAVFAVASLLLHLFRRWLERRLLPTTRMDEGMRASVATLVGYAGMVLAIAMALAAIGVGLERIAWIASALSVGIGFGLQAIVQNFISGLILLAERPVKVGDWVVVGDAEGDIRRINVRATEIQTGDRTTVLVPNSELITKAVRNRTYANAEGLVKIVLPMPLSTDAELVRSLLLEVMRGHPGVLDAPAPGVTLDGVDERNRLLFNATCYVATPRQAGGTRSDLLFEVLRRLRELRIRML